MNLLFGSPTPKSPNRCKFKYKGEILLRKDVNSRTWSVNFGGGGRAFGGLRPDDPKSVLLPCDEWPLIAGPGPGTAIEHNNIEQILPAVHGDRHPSPPDSESQPASSWPSH
jgi:hypothetical protein